MNKILKYIIFVLSAMSIHSCSYDYEMPDLSNAAPTYSVGGVSEELRQVLIEDAKEYGLTFEYSAEHWRTIVKEKDEKGNILYEGEPRGIADKNANTLQVSYVCSCMLQTANWNYYDICQFDFQKEFKLEISPQTCEAKLTIGDTYTKKVADNHPYTYNVDRSNLPVIDKAESLGYRIADVIMYITEKDDAGNQIKRFRHKTIDGYIITVGAEYIDVEVEILGFQNYSNKVVVGTYYFTNISLAEINGTTLNLTTDMEHEFYLPSDGYTYNVGRSYFTPVLESKVEELGLHIGDTKMYITEKDIHKNVIKTFPHEWIDGKNYFTSNAEYIDVTIRLYKDDEVKGSFVFRDIKLADINNSILELTTDMEYEYVSGS